MLADERNAHQPASLFYDQRLVLESDALGLFPSRGVHNLI